MRTAALLFLFVFIFEGSAFAQRLKKDKFTQEDTVVTPFFLAKAATDSVAKQIPENLTASLSTAVSSDTSGEIPQGVIYVQKPNIIPYVKVEYKYYLAHVNMVKVERPVDNGVPGNVEVENVPQFDSNMYSQKLQRVYPAKGGNPLLSKMFVENMQYRYNTSDTPRVDTMVMGMWINSRGKVQRVLDDPEYTLQMPEQMAEELTKAGQTVTEWGQPGGYYPKKKLFRKAPLTRESYYVEVFIIVSSYPLTSEQKITRYAPFDYPLNAPPINEQEKKSAEQNATIEPKR